MYRGGEIGARGQKLRFYKGFARYLVILFRCYSNPHFGLDDLPSWIMVTETNDFLWPGSDLSPVPGVSPKRFDYGMLPPRFFAHVRDQLLKVHLDRRLQRIPRTE
jgi:hypothetical protein